MRFCPECGTECESGATECGACRFPLTLTFKNGFNGVTIGRDQMAAWQRIAAWLRRSGLTLNQTEATELPRAQYWWALPAIGAFVFALSLIFGQGVVDSIWEPPKAPVPVVDLNRLGESTAAATDSSVSDGQTQALLDALSTTQEQRDLTEAWQEETMHSEREEPRMPPSEMLALAQQATLPVRVEDTRAKGTLIGRNGEFFVPTDVVDSAFRTEKRNVKSFGRLEQKMVFIQPEVRSPEGVWGACSLVEALPEFGLTLLQSGASLSTDATRDFDTSLDLGTELFLLNNDPTRPALKAVRVTNAVSNNYEINFWTLDDGLGVEGRGTPLFSRGGAIVGVYTLIGDQHAAVSLRELRERAPGSYRLIR